MTDAASTLTELLAECDAHGIRLLPSGDGELTIDAPQVALTPKLLDELKTHKAKILGLLRSMSDADLFEHESAAGAVARATKPVCGCGSTTWRDIPIHGGQSVRRDCGCCARFIAFPVWHGRGTLQNEK